MKQFYKLNELAGRWSVTVDEILHLAMNEELTISFWWHDGCVDEDGNSEVIEEFVNIDHFVAKKFAVNHVINGKIGVLYAYRGTGEKIELRLNHTVWLLENLTNETQTKFVNPYHSPAEMKISELVVLPDEVKRIESERGFLDVTEERLVGRKAIAEYLGVSVSTLKNRMKEYKYPKHKNNGIWEAKPTELDEWNRSRNKS
jgi:hypothetical protein